MSGTVALCKHSEQSIPHISPTLASFKKESTHGHNFSSPCVVVELAHSTNKSDKRLRSSSWLGTISKQVQYELDMRYFCNLTNHICNVLIYFQVGYQNIIMYSSIQLFVCSLRMWIMVTCRFCSKMLPNISRISVTQFQQSWAGLKLYTTGFPSVQTVWDACTKLIDWKSWKTTSERKILSVSMFPLIWTSISLKYLLWVV